jgi:outer membrane lipoprotein-sorting protein
MGSLFSFGQSDAEAISILDKLSEKSATYETLCLEFDFIIEDVQNASLDTFPGVFNYNAGKYRLDVIGQVIFSDGKTSWTYLKEVEEINITESNASSEPGFFDPITLLENYKTEYKCRFISDRFVRNRPLVEIDLYPINIDDKDYSRITLYIDKSKVQLYSAKYLGKDGVSYIVEFHTFKVNSGVSLDSVTFNELDYPDAEIIDMR